MNQAFFKKFNTNTSSPRQTKDNVFLLYDFVHLMKNIRNNSINEPMKELKFFVDEEEKVAKWTDIGNLYKLESQHLVKMSKLSKVAVYPSPIERQKVSLCLNVFCDETVCALKCHSRMQNAKDTVVFIEKVLQFWHIVNVKFPYEG